MEPIGPIAVEDIQAARRRIADSAIRSPLIRLNVDDAPAEIWLKLENLQPIGSFKLRGAGNAMALAEPDSLGRGVYTASAGNMAQGVAWTARRLGIPCSVIVPESAPRTKLAASARLGAKIVEVPFDTWWQVLEARRYPGMEGLFIHPVSEPQVIAGNATIGLETLEDLPDVDAVLVPYGGGGLSCGIATAIHATRPEVPVWACEPATAAPLAASLEAGKPVDIDYRPSFVDGCGGKRLLPEMWPMAREQLSGSLVCGLDEIARAVRLLFLRNRVVAEGAGALAVAAALSGKAGNGKVVCVVSGGNIDASMLSEILIDARLCRTSKTSI
ncbi:MAG: threonine/serine dehydratase [Woeseiaceae bacterium]